MGLSLINPTGLCISGQFPQERKNYQVPAVMKRRALLAGVSLKKCFAPLMAAEMGFQHQHRKVFGMPNWPLSCFQAGIISYKTAVKAALQNSWNASRRHESVSDQSGTHSPLLLIQLCMNHSQSPGSRSPF